MWAREVGTGKGCGECGIPGVGVNRWSRAQRNIQPSTGTALLESERKADVPCFLPWLPLARL